MKNKFLIILFSFIVICFNALATEQFRFETSEIELIDGGNTVLAKNGKAISTENDLEIDAKNFEYTKNLKLLKAFNGTAFFKNENLKIDFDEMSYDQISFLLVAKGNVKIYDLKRELSAETDIIFFNRDKKILESPTKSIIRDKSNNIFITQTFDYNLKNNILKIKDSTFQDIEKNRFKFALAYINTLSNKLYGKDVDIDLNNKSFNKNNEPRLKGNSVEMDENFTEITKGVFTTCKKREKCPPWQLSAENIQHDKKKKIINYKNAWLKVYDLPVIYFPKFFHPDPTVKRKSGFLTPSIQNSNNSNGFVNVPYYSVISSNKDFTFTPRFYADDKILMQTEYRQINKESFHISDFSIFAENNENSKSHFFYNFNRNMNFQKFQESDINLKIQKTSNDTFLKKNKIKSSLISNPDFLESSVDLDLYSDDLSINSGFIVYEDLTKRRNDRYEFILPRIDLIKSFDTNLNGELLLKSKNLVRNYQTNILEKTNINDLVFNSNPKITKSGLYNNHNFVIKNTNSDTQNSKDFKKDSNFYLSSLYQFNSALPLIKENKNYQNILKPKISLKVSPDFTKDISKKERKIDVNNIYSLNRISSNDSIEGGVSLTYGNDFTIFDKNDSKDIFGLKIANNLRLKENKDLPRTNQIGEKTSDFFGEITYNLNDILTTKYNTSIKNDLENINYENLVTEISINNFVTTFDYFNENNTSDKISYLKNTTKYNLNDTSNVSFSTRKNKKTDLTEYYNLMYQYKNDCLAASIEYNKEYYNDRDISTEENIFFKLTIIPFGEASTPNLKN